jgi:hypothetical protein
VLPIIQLQTHRPPDGRAENVCHRSGILAERETEIATENIFYIDKKLLNHGFVGTKQFRILLVDLLDASRIAHTLGHPCYDSRDRIAWHQAGQGEVQYEGENEGNDEPTQLVEEILPVSFQRGTSK